MYFGKHPAEYRRRRHSVTSTRDHIADLAFEKQKTKKKSVGLPLSTRAINDVNIPFLYVLLLPILCKNKKYVDEVSGHSSIIILIRNCTCMIHILILSLFIIITDLLLDP